jgi:hypothetical protein
MTTWSRFSRWIRGQSSKSDLFFEIRRKKEVLENLQPTLRRCFLDFDSRVTSISMYFPPMQPTMTSSYGSSGTGGAISSQASTSSLIRSMCSHYNPIESTTNHVKFIKQYGLLKFEEDANTTLCHVSSPLDLASATTPLPKFKDHLHEFSSNGTISVKEHLIAF